MSLPTDLKFMGPIRAYQLEDGQFSKTYEDPRRLASELKGSILARRVGIPVIPILHSNQREVVFEAVGYPRLDQVLMTGTDLDLVRDAGRTLARLHHHTEIDLQPDLSVPRESLLVTIIGLHSYGDTPPAIHRQIVSQVTNRLAEYGDVEHACYTHGDFTAQNLFVARTLIPFDWENSSYSDPAYDLATFISFMMQFMAKQERSFAELLVVEDSLLSGYDEEHPVGHGILQRYEFYKIFDRHTMYWFYLFLLRELARTNMIPIARNYLQGTLDSLDDIVLALHGHGFGLKASSLNRIFRMLARSPGQFALPCTLVLDLDTLG